MKEKKDLINKWIAMQAVQGIDSVATLRDGDPVIRMSAIEHVLENLPGAPDINVGNIDTISRQAALEKIKKMQTYKMFAGDDLLLIDQAEAQTELMMLPSAQPEQRWIPCSDRMPEEHEWIGTKRFGTTISDEVYVTFEAPDGQRFADHISFQNGKLSASDAERMRVWYKGAKPIAWMPLPEVYKGEQK